MIAKYKCQLCGEIFSAEHYDNDEARLILTSAKCLKVGLPTLKSHNACIVHETDTHLGIADLVGFEKE